MFDSGPRLEPTLLVLADRAAQTLSLGDLPLDASDIVAEAERKSRRPFRTPGVEHALAMLIDACEREADLSVFGRFTLRFDALRKLRNLMRFDEAEEADPEIVKGEIAKPIFVTGLPRSGTTFLHTLLALDPDNCAPLCWQTMQPYPDARDRARDRRAERVERELRAFRRIAPGVGDLHLLAADTPQECTEITAHVFQSLRYDTTYHIPSYLSWLEARGHIAAFQFHKRFLQHLQAQGGARRWVLKCPDHVFALEAITATYPDARFVFVHRDPTAVLPSLVKLTEVLRSPFTRKLDKFAMAEEVTRRLEGNAERILAAGDFLPPDRLLHLRYDEVTADPVGTLERLYRHFRMPFSPAARAKVTSFVARQPRGGYGVNRYDPAEFGLDLARTRRRFERYTSAFAPLAPPAGRA